METVQKKKCNVCGEEKILDKDFYKNRTHKDGYSSQCKPCQHALTKKSAIKTGKIKGLKRMWPEEDLQYLRDNYATGDMSVMLAHLNNIGVSNSGKPFTTLVARDLTNKASYIGLGGIRQIVRSQKAKAKKKVYVKKVKVPKPVQVKTVKPEKVYHRELPRFKEKVFATKELPKEYETLRIDKRTQIQIPKGLSENERTVIINRYSKQKTLLTA